MLCYLYIVDIEFYFVYVTSIYIKTILYRNQKNNRSQINVRENRRDGQEWTIQRHMNDWVHAKIIIPYAYI